MSSASGSWPAGIGSPVGACVPPSKPAGIWKPDPPPPPSSTTASATMMPSTPAPPPIGERRAATAAAAAAAAADVDDVLRRGSALPLHGADATRRGAGEKHRERAGPPDGPARGRLRRPRRPRPAAGPSASRGARRRGAGLAGVSAPALVARRRVLADLTAVAASSGTGSSAACLVVRRRRRPARARRRGSASASAAPAWPWRRRRVGGLRPPRGRPPRWLGAVGGLRGRGAAARAWRAASTALGRASAARLVADAGAGFATASTASATSAVSAAFLVVRRRFGFSGLGRRRPSGGSGLLGPSGAAWASRPRARRPRS